jgi:hypothetical protein
MFHRTVGRARTVAALAWSIVMLAGCGDDGPSGPSDDFDLVGGEWQWRVTDAVSGNSSCSITGVTLTFSRQSGVLAGHRVAHGGGNMTCTFNGSNSVANYTTDDDIDDLTFSGTDISYSFATTSGAWEMSGSITGDDSMGGTAIIRVDTSIGSFTLTGPWVATRN